MESKDFDIRSYLLGYMEGAERKNSKSKKTCQWTHENGDFWHETSCGKECSNGEFGEVTENFVYCPYCGNKIEQG